MNWVIDRVIGDLCLTYLFCLETRFSVTFLLLCFNKEHVAEADLGNPVGNWFVGLHATGF